MSRRSILPIIHALEEGVRDDIILHLIDDFVENYGTSPGDVTVVWKGEPTTLLNKAAQLGERRIVEELLALGSDPSTIRNPADNVLDLIQ